MFYIELCVSSVPFFAFFVLCSSQLILESRSLSYLVFSVLIGWSGVALAGSKMPFDKSSYALLPLHSIAPAQMFHGARRASQQTPDLENVSKAPLIDTSNEAITALQYLALYNSNDHDAFWIA